MAEENQNKLGSAEPAEGMPSAPVGVETPGSVGEGRVRRGRSVASLDVETGPFAGLSVDTFAVPSERPLERNEDPARKLTGPEPAVFGGVNPDVPAAAVTDPDAPPVEETVAGQVGGVLDAPLRSGDLLADVPKIDYLRIVRSTSFLLGAMVACLIAATLLIRLIVKTETYVQTSVHFNNYTQLDEQEQGQLQLEINTVLRTYPLRKQAWDILQTKAPELKPGFLDSGLTFHRLDSITWFPEGVVQMRVDSDDPASDLMRLRAVSEAFYQQMDDRNHRRDEYRDTLKSLEQDQLDLAQEDEKLKRRINELLPEAQRYADLKQSLQAMERYVEMADESNPLRVVAQQNLARLTQQVAAARQLSSVRDGEIAKRITLQKKIADTAEAIRKMRRQIEVFPWPDPPDAKTLHVRDTRSLRATVQRTAWVSIILFFGGIVFLLHLHDQRVAEAARRERREKLKAQKQQLEQDAS